MEVADQTKKLAPSSAVVNIQHFQCFDAQKEVQGIHPRLSTPWIHPVNAMPILYI